LDDRLDRAKRLHAVAQGKGWLFAGSPDGAETSALLYSLVETAKANGPEPGPWETRNSGKFRTRKNR